MTSTPEPLDDLELVHRDAANAAESCTPSIDVDRLLSTVRERARIAGLLPSSAASAAQRATRADRGDRPLPAHPDIREVHTGRAARIDADAVLVGARTGSPQVHARQEARHAPIRTAVIELVDTDLLTETYRNHYTSLLRLASLLLDDMSSIEDVVQEAFIRVHSARSRIREPEKLLAYLRQTVVNLSRSALRRRLLGLRLLPKPMPDAASAEEGAYDALERDALIQALRSLQRRQREVLVLRYYGDLTEAQIADVLGVSIGSVKAYSSRGIEALRARMQEHQ